METFFDIIFAILVAGSVWANFFFLKTMKEVKSLLLDMHMKDQIMKVTIEKLEMKTEQLASDCHSAITLMTLTLNDLKGNYQEIPKRINNWDNIKKAFEGPVRLETNQRAQ